MISNIHHSKNGLNIIIVGCGKVGAALVEQLVREGHDITIIDKNPQKFKTIQIFMILWGLLEMVQAIAFSKKLE